MLVLLKMARTAKPLTNTEVQQAKPKGKEFNLVDGDGLALRVKPNGSKLWILNYYRPYTKKRTSLSLGTYPSITLAEARQKRSELRKLLTDDIDPKEYREEQARVSQEAHSNTLEHVAAQWLDEKKRPSRRIMPLTHGDRSNCISFLTWEIFHYTKSQQSKPSIH